MVSYSAPVAACTNTGKGTSFTDGTVLMRYIFLILQNNNEMWILGEVLEEFLQRWETSTSCT